MFKHSLFAEQEREAKLNELGNSDTLRLREQHVDLAASASALASTAPQQPQVLSMWPRRSLGGYDSGFELYQFSG